MATPGKIHSTSSTSNTSEVRYEFKTKEGLYKNLKTHQYSKARGQPLMGRELSETQISVVSVKDMQGLSEWIVFNSGRELLCYSFGGAQEIVDLSSPVDKHAYRTSYPTSHHINPCTRSTEQLDLIVGFDGGALQHFNPLTKTCLGVYNADRNVDATAVTCVRWVPGSDTQFVSTHRSGHMYVWTTDYAYKGSNLPAYHVYKQLKDTTIHVCKPKKGSALTYKWDIGHGSIQHFCFSPDTQHVAIVNQDGFLRVYNFSTHEFYGRMRSYYGGFLCVCWSPDGKYIVTGGEDDLVSVWSFKDRHVLARGQGHNSYVNMVAFDPYTSEMDSSLPSTSDLASTSVAELKSQRSSRFFPEESKSYRLGSVGQDGLLCLWELSGANLSIVRRLHGRTRSRIMSKQSSMARGNEETREEVEISKSKKEAVDSTDPTSLPPLTTPNEIEGSTAEASIGSDVSDKKSEEKSTKTKVKKKLLKKKKTKDNNEEEGDQTVELQSPVEHSKDVLPEKEHSTTKGSKIKEKKKKNNGEGSEAEKPHKSSSKFSVRRTVKNLIAGPSSSSGSRRIVSTFESCHSDDIAPSMQDVNLIEPLVCKKVWSERLTDIVFKEEAILTATQDGYVHVWARPEFANSDETFSSVPAGLNSPRPGEADSKHTSS